MSVVVPELSSISAQLDSLRQLVEQDPEQKLSLVVAHDDPLMVRRLTSAVGSSHVAVLSVTQAEWDQCLDEVLSWLTEQNLDRLILVGHSDGLHGAAKSASAGLSAASGPLAGVRRMQHQLRISREHFAEQMRRLTEACESREMAGEPSVHIDALFYVASSDLFLKYGPATHAFVPLYSCL